MTAPPHDTLLLGGGDHAALARCAEALAAIPVDEERPAPPDWTPPRFATTIAAPAEVTGPGTYDKRGRRALRFRPATAAGWRFRRHDLGDQAAPIPVALHAVRSASRALLLGAEDSADNCIGMAEHIIAHRLGLAISDLEISCDSYDPPLFDQGSREIVEALQAAGIAPDPSRPLPAIAPRQPAAMLRPDGSGFLLWTPPADPGDRRLHLEVAVDFPNAIGRQRIHFELCPQNFAHGAMARTNCAASEVILARTIGWLSPRYRNFGYNRRNILVAGRRSYRNEPALLLPNGKSLEAVWHRACLDLVAALSLLPPGWPCGRFVSYKGGHVLDVAFLTRLQDDGLLTELY